MKFYRHQNKFLKLVVPNRTGNQTLLAYVFDKKFINKQLRLVKLYVIKKLNEWLPTSKVQRHTTNDYVLLALYMDKLQYTLLV